MTIRIAFGSALAIVACPPAYADPAPPLSQIAEPERFPAEGGLTHAEDGVVLPDGRLLVGDWNHGLVTIAPDGKIAPFGNFAAAGFRTQPDPLWNSPNGIAWEPDGRHVLVADITGGHIYRVDTVTQQVARIYDHPFGVNAAIRDPSGAIWFTQSTRNAPGAGSESRMFAAADRPMGDGSVWRIAPGEVGKPAPRAVRLVDGLDFANGIVFDAQRGRLYVAEIVASRILSFAVDPATGALSDRRVLARVTTPDNLELAADGMLWAASPFANAIYRINPDSGAASTVFNPDPAKSARMVAELERRQAAGEPLLPLLSPELWAPMPGLVTGVILPPGEGAAYVSGLGDALVRLDPGTGSGPDADRTAAAGTEPHPNPHSHSHGPDAVLAAPEHHEVLLENDRVRVLDTCIGPGEQTRVHAHGWPAVQYVVKWSDFVRRDPDGKILADSRNSRQHPVPGQALWSGPVAPHSIENVGSDDLCVIAMEMKEEGGDAVAPSGTVPQRDSETEAARRQIQQTIDTVYAAISGPAGSPRDWNAFRAMFSEDARLFTITAEDLRGGGVEDYIALSDEALVEYGFREEELVNRIEVYGNLAQAWSSYEGHFVRDGEPGSLRGINGFQFQRQADGSWRVHSLLWQQETAEFSLPDDMANAARPVAGPAGEAEIQTILDNRTSVILEGIRSGDVSGIMALYGPGSLYATDNATLLSDPEAIEAFWVGVAASPAHDATLEVLRVERLGPDAFVEIQKYDVFDEAGARLFGGYASLLWRKVEGRWIIAADVSN